MDVSAPIGGTSSLPYVSPFDGSSVAVVSGYQRLPRRTHQMDVGGGSVDDANGAKASKSSVVGAQSVKVVDKGHSILK